MIKRICIISLTSLTLAIPMFAKSAKNVLSQTITDEAIVYPESFETDARKMLEGWYMKNYTATDKNYANLQDVKTTDEEYQKRLSELPCVIEMPYNQIVRQYIERYTKNGRPQVAALLGLSIYYMPIFEQALEEEGLPLELKYLPVIESGLDPNAVSRHGAAGLWQFMLGAAKGLGLEVNSLVDERRDPYTSSRTAASFLKDLYSTYGDWSLAIAAYNCGPGAVNKAIRRAGGDPKSQDFWSIYYYLPAETRGYVPMFIAANYVMNYYTKHNISPVLPTKPLVTDTVGVNNRVHFDQISAVLNIPKDELRVLNPQFRADVIPATADKTFYLILPSQQIHAYIMSEPQIIGYKSDLYARRATAAPGGNPDATEADLSEQDLLQTEPEPFAVAENTVLRNTPDKSEPDEKPVVNTKRNSGKKRTVTHSVAAGETLVGIAELYGVSASEIRRANHLRRNAVRPGQQLSIETTVSADAIDAATAKKNVKNTSTTRNMEVVNPDDTPATEMATIRSNSRAATAKATVTAKNAGNKTGKKKSKNKPYVAPKPTKHEVKSGENLTTIAKKYGVSVDELKKANKGAGDMIHPGDDIKIPSKGKSSGKKGKKSKRKGKRH